MAEAIFDLLASGRLADPDIAFIRRTQGVACAADQVVHGAPARDVARREACDFRFALLVVFIKLDARAIFERNKEAVGRGSPGIAERRKIELFDDEGMQQAGQIGARRHVDAGPGLFHRAGAADAVAAFENENAFPGAGEIGGAGEPVVSGAHDDRIPFHWAPLAFAETRRVPFLDGSSASSSMFSMQV